MPLPKKRPEPLSRPGLGFSFGCQPTVIIVHSWIEETSLGKDRGGTIRRRGHNP